MGWNIFSFCSFFVPLSYRLQPKSKRIPYISLLLCTNINAICSGFNSEILYIFP